MHNEINGTVTLLQGAWCIPCDLCRMENEQYKV